MVDVEQGALRAFEQDALARRLRLVERQPDGLHEREDEAGDVTQFRHQRVAVDRLLVEACAQGVVVGGQAIELRA